MFGQTTFTVKPQKSSPSVQKPPKMQSPGPARRNILSKPRCATPAATSSRQASKPNQDSQVSERFKNHAYNRQPSPVGRFLAFGRGSKDSSSENGRTVQERARRTSPKTAVPQCSESVSRSDVTRRRVEKQSADWDTKRLPARSEKVRPPLPKSAVTYSSVAECRSDVLRRRMEEQSVQQESTSTPTSSERARPKTTEFKRTNDKPAPSDSPSFENKVFLAVKEVLSRAVIEKGKIDVTNINNIIENMKNRIVGKEPGNHDSDDEARLVNVNLKRSTTRLNIDPELPNKNNTFVLSKAKPLPGIIRRNIAEQAKKAQKIYKTAYNKDDSPSSLQKTQSKSNNYDLVNDTYESTMYIDIPDSDYSNFNSLLKREAEVSKLALKKKIDDAKHLEDLSLKKEQQADTLENRYCLGDSNNKTENDSSYIEGRGGDCSLGVCQPQTFWKAAEDVKLQAYIESLIRNMNDQLNGKTSNRVFENQIETEETVCKSFCVCKVCVSSKTSSRKTLNDNPSRSNVKGISQSELKLKNSALNNSITAASSSKQRQSKVFSKDANRESNFRILQRNANFQPESKLNLASRYAMGHDVKHAPSGPYMVVAPEEASEDYYLQRRVGNKAPVKRRMSTKI